MADIIVDLNGDGTFDKDDDPLSPLAPITDETGDGTLDVNLTGATSMAIIDGAVFQDAANVGSGTGNYNTFLALQDKNGDDTVLNPNVEAGFNAGLVQGPDPSPEDTSNSEMDASKSEAILLGSIPIVIGTGTGPGGNGGEIGVAYYEFRTDLNENNNGDNPLLSLDQFKLYVGGFDLDAGAGVDLVDTVAELETLTKVYDMDGMSGEHDISVLMNEATSSGSGNDDYSVLVPVSNFGSADPATTYVYLYVQMGIADGVPPDSWGASGGFHEWNLQNAVIIQGQKFNDIDGDGIKDAGEGGVAGVTIYIDDDLDGIVEATDNNGVLDAGEQSDITDADGNYSFGGIPLRDADYTIYIREVVPAGSVPTTTLPVAVVIDKDLAAGTIIDSGDFPGLLIGNRQLTPHVTLTKDASGYGDCADTAGETILYTVVADNDGELTLTNVVLTDNFEGGGNVTLTVTGDTNLNTVLDVGEVWLSGDTNGNSQMETSETWTYTYLRAVTQAMIDSNGGGNGTLTDVATVNADSTNGSVTDNDDATVEVCQDPALDIDKDASVPGDCADTVGELITYTVVLDNIGNVALDNVVLTDAFEGGSDVTLTVTGDTNLNTVLDVGEVWLSGDTGNDGIMGVNETWTYSYVRAVTQAMIDSNGGGDGTLDNVATANADAVNSSEAAEEVSDDASVTVCQDPALDIDKDASVPGDCADTVGELVTYTVVLDNIGNVALDNVVLEDNFEGNGNVTLTVTGDTNLNTVLDVGEVWLSGDTGNDGIMGVNETWTYSYVRAVTQEDIDSNGYGNGTLDNVATANADAVNSSEAAEEVSDDASVDVCQDPLIDIEKFVMTDINGAFADADDPDGPEASTSTTVDFKVVLTNTGNVTLENIHLSDSVIHTVGGVPGAPVAIDYSDPALGAFVDVINVNGVLDAGEEWINFDTNSDGTLDIDENGDPFELSVGETVNIYYSLTSALGQHENTAVVTADAVTTGEDAGDDDDANYYVVATEDCVGVRTPGFWANTKWMTFWDGVGAGWGTAPNEPKQAGTPGFADGELLYKVFLSDTNGDTVIDDTDAFSTGLLVGDYNLNGITDAGEDTIFIALPDAIKLINASSKQLVEGKGTADGIYMLGRDTVATWLNYLANNQETIGECIGDVSGATNTPREYLDAAIDWFQQFASTTNGNPNQNLVNSYHDGNAQALFQFDARVNPSSASWQNPVTQGEDIPVSAAAMHAALDAYNNTGAINGIEYCCDADSEVALFAISLI